MGNTANSSKDSDNRQRNRFIELASRLAELAAGEGLKIVPFKDPALPHFFEASFSQREHVLQMLGHTVKICEDTKSRGQQISRSAPLIWTFCLNSKYKPASDFYDKIQEGDMVDVYNEHGQLIFANLIFYALVSYSLEELHCRPWHQLFVHQPATVQDKLREICNEILAGPHGLRDLRSMPKHLVVGTSEPMRAVVQPTFFSSLLLSGKIAGFICINRIENVIATAN